MLSAGTLLQVRATPSKRSRLCRTGGLHDRENGAPTEPAYIRAASQRLMATQSWATKPGCAIFAYVHMCACVHA